MVAFCSRRCVAVCRSVLQCVAVSCSVLQKLSAEQMEWHRHGGGILQSQVSPVTYVDESCHTYKWTYLHYQHGGILQSQVRHVTHVDETCHEYNINESCHARTYLHYQCGGILQVKVSRATHMDGKNSQTLNLLYENNCKATLWEILLCVMSEIWESPRRRSCIPALPARWGSALECQPSYSYEWAMLHIWMSYALHELTYNLSVLPIWDEWYGHMRVCHVACM